MSKGNYLNRKQYFMVASALQKMAASNGQLEGKTYATVAGLIGKETGVPLTETNIRKVAAELSIRWKGSKPSKPNVGENSFVARCFRRMDRIDAALKLICEKLQIEYPPLADHPAVTPEFAAAAEL